ncbi:MAG: nitroreductase family protein [Candidatus Woesearchaeota archaeon]
MNIFEVIERRRSIRNYSEEPVEWDKVVKILESAIKAPSSGNVQNWRFVIVTDKNLRAKLAEASLQQYWMEKAPIHIVVCSENFMVKKLYGERGEKLYAIQNCAAAIQNMLLTATALGLGSCWVGAFEDEAVARILGISGDVTIQAIITLGYSHEKPSTPMHITLEDVCYFEKYKNKIKDIDTVLWNFNVVGKAVKSTKNFGLKITEKLKRRLKQKNK